MSRWASNVPYLILHLIIVEVATFTHRLPEIPLINLSFPETSNQSRGAFTN
jgi:hypothetical protein